MARVLHLISSNERRGAEVFAMELAEHLRSVGHEVRVLAIEPTSSDQRLDAEVAGRHRLDPAGIARALSAARWADVVVSFGSTSLITGSMVARLTRRPFVYRNIGDPSVWGIARLATLRIGAPLRSAAALVALYPEAKSNLIRMYGLDPARARVIPRGVSATRFTPSDADERLAARQRLGLDPDRRWVAYVGALSPEKDPLFALEVLRLLPDHVSLVVAGGGALESEMAAGTKEFGDRLRLLGTVSDVRDVLAATDLLVLTSRTEGIPGAVIEAGLSGVATVATAVGGVPYTIDDRVTGRLVELDSPEAFADAVVDALDRSDELGAAALDKCRTQYSMAGVGAAWERVLDDVLSTPDRGATSGSVLHVTASTQRRGAEMFASQLATALGRLGFRSTSVAVSGAYGPNSLPIQVLGNRRFRPSTLWRLYRRARAHDVVVAHGSSSLLPVAVTAGLARRPFVYRIIGDPSYWGRVRFARWRIGLPLRRASTLVALTLTSADWICAHYDVDPSRIVVSPNAVDTAAFPPSTREARERAREALGIDADQFVLGYLGSLSSEKRPDWAVSAAAARPDGLLLVGGEGPMRTDLERIATEIAPGRVRFLGALDDPHTLVSAIDLLLLPSVTEGMPAVVIEAALCGVPTIATDVGAVREIVTAFGLGTVVPADSFDEFAAAVTASDTAPHAAPPSEAVQRFNISHVAVEWGELLRRLTSDSPSPPRAVRGAPGDSLIR